MIGYGQEVHHLVKERQNVREIKERAVKNESLVVWLQLKYSLTLVQFQLVFGGNYFWVMWWSPNNKETLKTNGDGVMAGYG